MPIDVTTSYILRVNYQSFIWRNSHLATVDVPSPVGKGWQLEDGYLVVEWTSEDVLPPQLVDVLASRDLQQCFPKCGPRTGAGP